MPSHLTIISGSETGRSCELTPGIVLLIGRGTDCDLQLNDPSVSRLQCRLIVEATGVRLEDAGSRYGTLVNGRVVEQIVLRNGDVILVGDTELRYEADAAVASTIVPRRNSSVLPHAERLVDVPAAPPRRITAEGFPKWTGTGDLSGLIGTTFLRYQVQEQMARGASGLVFRAVDTKFERPVVLKVFWPQLFADTTSMARFLRSMRTMVPLAHPHLVKVHAAGRSKGLCFTASELVDGESAAQRIRRIGIAGMLDWQTTWRIAVGLTQALDYLHERSILHRSIRPNNILIRQHDLCVKLGDSLLAKSLEEIGADALSKSGEVVGELEYLSPEQVSGSLTIDPRADLYSLGATLYALLTGRPPFIGAAQELVGQILSARPEPPTKQHLAIPAEFEGVVLKLLAKRPDDRYQTAAEVLKELHRAGRNAGLV